ncbi:MAG: acyl-CoA dehydrogenase family protein, partial [Chloroflexota bacterium]
MEFTLTEEQLALKRLAHEFAEREIRPIASARDRMPDPAAGMDWDVIRKGSKLGLRTLTIPEEFGGGGADTLTVAIVGEELGWGDLGVAYAFDQTWKYGPALALATTPEQREKFLPAFMADETHLMAIAFTEPDAGTDNMFPFDAPGMGLMMRAERRGSDYILNGTKIFISNGGAAKMCIVCARTDPSVGVTRGSTAFLVPADTPGYRVGRYLDKMGRRLLMNAEIVFEDCRVPAFNRLGEENGAWELQRGRSYGRGSYGATVLGTARAALEDALAHARDRVQGGKPIIEHQNI